MSESPDWVELRRRLRCEADELLAAISPTHGSAQPADVMLHELLVHKIELEMQIEELKRSHLLLEEARDHYAALCESSPTGLLTVGRNGVIAESNPQGARLLGVGRATPVGRHLARFVAATDGDRWHRLFIRVLIAAEVDEQTCVIELERADGSRFPAYLSCRRYTPPGGDPVLHITLIDLEQIRRAQEGEA